MKTIQLVKKLNKTEVGKSGTHETYILVPNDLNVDDIFESLDTKIQFLSRENSTVYTIRLTRGREKRIVGLGPFYRDFNADAGDIICLEKIIGEDVKYFISLRRSLQSMILQKSSYGVKILKGSIDVFKEKHILDNGQEISLQYNCSEKERTDSTSKTDFYNLFVDGVDITRNYKNKELIEIDFSTEHPIILDSNNSAWKKYIVEVNI